MQITTEISKIKKPTQRGLYFTFNAILKHFNILQHFGVKTLPVQDMERCYLQKKICVTTWDFKNDLVVVVWLLHGIHELHCGINVYKKNSVVSIFK